MAKANLVKKAQKNIYVHGKNVEYVSQKGKRQGQKKTKLDRTTPADETDAIFIAKGESYYWWQFKNSPKRYSKERPKQSQLTQSNFLSQLYEIEEEIEEFTCDNKEDFESFRDEIKEKIEALRDECQESLDNMPDSLQSSPNGELLQERIDALDGWASEIGDVECDYDEDELREEVRDELTPEKEEDDGEEKDEDDEDEEEEEEESEVDENELETQLRDKINEKVDEAIEELKETSHGL